MYAPSSSLSADRYALALHTASPELGLAASNFHGDARCQTWDLDREISTQLHGLLAEFLRPQTWQEIAFLAVAKGPGSFTGTRVGVVTARTIAQQLQIPLFAVSCLAAIARAARCDRHQIPPTADLAVQMPARRNCLFVAIYKQKDDGNLLTLLPERAIAFETWQETLDRWPNEYYAIEAPERQGKATPHLLELAYFAWQQGQRPHWSEALPFYGQHPVATTIETKD